MGTRNLRWPAGVVIGGFWLLMTGVLLHRELGGSFFSPGRQGAGSLAEELPEAQIHEEMKAAGDAYSNFQNNTSEPETANQYALFWKFE